MSGHVVLRIRPGESLEDFTRRIVDTAPDAPPHVIDRIGALLVPSAPPAEAVAHSQAARAAA